MTEPENLTGENRPEAFVREADRKPRGFIAEYWEYLRRERKWWLAPVVFFLLAASAFIILGGTGLAPFIYALF